MDWGQLFGWWDAGVRELGLLAAVLFLIGGVDDFAVDLVYGWLRLTRRSGVAKSIDDLTAPAAPFRYAIFVPAWDESAVIGRMLRHTLDTIDHPAFRLFVGVYSNDPATVEIAEEIAAADARVVVVRNPRPGPTTKADCLNAIWQALHHEQRRSTQHFDAIVLHDAEDVVHPAELSVFDAYLGHCPAVQVPVVPIVDRTSRWVCGHYLDEFAESHGKTLLVRQALGAALPLAGVGCAIRIEYLDRIAERRGGAPFDADCLVEDYEMGLEVAAACLARVSDTGGELVAVGELFPNSVDEAVKQKARWITGIALAGWDRVGWRRDGGWSDHWFRLRDRRTPLAAIATIIGYVVALAWLVSMAVHALAGQSTPVDAGLLMLLRINLALLAWRALVRASFTGRAHGWREGLLAVPRMGVGSLIMLAAARKASDSYLASLNGVKLRWDKTAHRFPDQLDPAE